MTYHYEGDAHETQQPPTLLVVLPRNLDLPPRKPVHILGRSNFLGLFTLLLCLFSLFVTLRQLYDSS